MELRWPDEAMLGSYVDAIERGWSPHTMVAEEGIRELAAIRLDPAAFVRQLVEANGGVLVERFRRDGAYGGTDALRFRIRL